MPTLEYNFSDQHLELIRDTGAQGDVVDLSAAFDPTVGDYIRMSVFDDNDIFIESVYSNLSGFDESVVEVEYDIDWATGGLDPQLRIYKATESDNIFVKPNEVLEERDFEAGNYQLMFEFLNNPFDTVGEELVNRTYFFIKEISASRKEVKLIARNGVDQQISIIETMTNELHPNADPNVSYEYDFVLVLPAGQNIPILNYMIDTVSNPTWPSLILKLYQALPASVGNLIQVTIEKEIFTTQTEDIWYKTEDYIGPSTGQGLGKDGLLDYEDHRITR
jgi:hypothetical protein